MTLQRNEEELALTAIVDAILLTGTPVTALIDMFAAVLRLNGLPGEADQISAVAHERRTSMNELHPHQLTSDECAADPRRAALNAAKQAAHEAYLAANRAIGHLHEHGDPPSADPAWIAIAEAAREHAWKLYDTLVKETEW